MKRLSIGIALTAFATVGTVLILSSSAVAPDTTTTPTPLPSISPTPLAEAFDKTRYSISEPGSLWWIVNKSRPLDKAYAPKELVKPNVILHSQKQAEELSLVPEAATAIQALFDAANIEDIVLMLASGYRSYARQQTYYNSLVASMGKTEADKVSAVPGTSEHQTGLALDIARPDRSCYLQLCFAGSREGRWLAANAYKYGFILRYPEGKESVTGYSFEPWHYRYVGVELATELHNTGFQTLEEYFGL